MAELIHRLLERNARKYPTEAAVRYPAGEVSWTWRDLNTRANALAHYLVDQGLRPGDRVALLIPNRPSFVQAFFAALKAGAVVVPINARLTKVRPQAPAFRHGVRPLLFVAVRLLLSV